MKDVIAALGLLVAASGPVAAASNAPAVAADAAQDSAFAELRAKDARVARLGYQLATANAPYCEDVVPATGLLLHDMMAYGDPDAVRKALGLTSDIGIQAVVPGSPADQAGLAVDQSIARVASVAVANMPADRKKRWRRLENIRTSMAAVLAQTGQLSIARTGERDLILKGTPACRSRFEVGPLGKRAVANGERVVIGDRFPGHDWPDDLLAAVIAHELAHNVLGHRKWFDANGRKQKYVRLTEREADRLAPWLLANAGFEPSAALRFMQTWGPLHSGGLLRKRTHEGWDERAEHIAAEIRLVEQHRVDSGRADWKTHFQREDLPDL